MKTHINYGQGRYDLPLSQCPVQHPSLFALSAYPGAWNYDHGITEWYRSYDAAKERLMVLPEEALWRGERVEQTREPIPLSNTGCSLWKIILKYSDSYWV